MSEGRPWEDSSSARTASKRPASIGELAERAAQLEWDASHDLKHCLRLAESARNQARAYHSAGDLESAFVFYARAATIALERLPAHPQYRSALKDAQRDNLGLNGRDIIDRMDRLKPVLVDRFNKWRAAHPEATLLPLSHNQDSPMTAANFSKTLKDEAAAWRRWREKYDNQVQQERQRQIRPQPQRQPTLDRRKHDSSKHSPAVSVADYAFVQPPSHGHGSLSTKVVVMPPVNPELSQHKKQVEQQGILRRQQEAEADARQIRQTIAVNNALPRGHHQQGSLSAHSSLSSVNNMFPHTQTSSLATTPTSSYHRVHPQMSTSSQPTIYPLHLQSIVPPPVVAPPQQTPPPQNPFTPVRVQNATPSPVLTPISRHPTPSHSRTESPAPLHLFPGSSPINLHRTPTRASIRSHGSQNFFSTTSPPKDTQALFPSLMSPHQQQQGYYPSHYSISMSLDRLKLNDTADTSPSTPLNPSIGIHAPSVNPPPLWMFGPQEGAKSAAAVASAAQSAQGIVDGGVKSKNSGIMTYHNPLPPPPGMGVDNGPLPSCSVPYIPMPPPPPNSSSASQALSADRRIPPPLPALPIYPQSQSQCYSNQRQEQHQYQDKHRRSSSSHRGKRLKTVVLPREVLPRFLAIASLNTNANIETCGLLLGNEVRVDGGAEHGRWHNESGNNERENVGEGMKKKSEYVVTTLLIPKQRATSDTCTMDGEELVLEFVDQRSLITLGWIHTHPSQSCFMSSVDLHTHSGFQKMLPESVAVVCAPKSNPNFGIFRLTDPPGLSTILECKEKEAFHPHPDLPIYTDADKGHVQMQDSALEIIDMR